MGEDKRCSGDVADSAGAEGEVLEGSPAVFEQGESAFAEAAEGSQEFVVGAVVRAEGLAFAGLFDGVWMPIPAPS